MSLIPISLGEVLPTIFISEVQPVMGSGGGDLGGMERGEWWDR